MTKLDLPAPGETEAPPDLTAALAAAGLPLREGEALPVFNAEAIAAALIDRSGRIVAASPTFAALQVDPGVLARAGADAGPWAAVVGLAGGEAEARSAIFAYALAAQATTWSLPPEVAEAAVAHPGHVVVLTSQTIQADGALRRPATPMA